MIVAYIDRERVLFNPDDVTNLGWTNGLQHITTEDGQEFYIFESSEAAGEAAREYWEDMADNDKEEFTCLVGSENLIEWALGNAAGPGYSKVNSLEDWFELWEDVPEEQFASYDGTEREFKCKHPDWNFYTVAYRYN